MPQRFVGLITAVAGLATVLLLAMAGVKLHRAAATGPRWKRKLVTAGLLVLALFGLPARADEKPAAVDPAKVLPRREVTCYLVAFVTDGQESLQRLNMRLPLLEKLASDEKLTGATVAQTLVAVEGDLAILEKDKRLADLDSVKKLRRSVKDAVARIRARLLVDSEELTKTDEWKLITEAWAEAAPLAKSGTSTTKQRDAAKAKLEAAVEGAKRLAAKGALSEAEAGLLESDAKRLQREIYRNPPTDCKIMCYDMMFLPPAHSSLKRTEQRLPLLRKVVAGGALHPAALRKLLPAIESDIATLSNDELLRALSETDRGSARQARDDARAVLEQLRALLENDEDTGGK